MAYARYKIAPGPRGWTLSERDDRLGEKDPWVPLGHYKDEAEARKYLALTVDPTEYIFDDKGDEA